MRDWKSWVTPTFVVMMASVVAYDHLLIHSDSLPIPPSINGRNLGRAYAPVVVSTLADGWLAAAKAIEDGKSIVDAQKALQETWHDGRTKVFAAKVAPDFARLLASGQEPKDAEQRAAVVKLWRDFAAGLKGGR